MHSAGSFIKRGSVRPADAGWHYQGPRRHWAESSLEEVTSVEEEKRQLTEQKRFEFFMLLTKLSEMAGVNPNQDPETAMPYPLNVVAAKMFLVYFDHFGIDPEAIREQSNETGEEKWRRRIEEEMIKLKKPD